MASSRVSRTMAGMLSRPTAWAARQRRSPMTSSYFSPSSCANHDRLEEADLLDGGLQLLQRLLVEDVPGLLRVRHDRVDRDLGEPGTGHRAQLRLAARPRGRCGGRSRRRRPASAGRPSATAGAGADGDGPCRLIGDSPRRRRRAVAGTGPVGISAPRPRPRPPRGRFFIRRLPATRPHYAFRLTGSLTPRSAISWAASK